MCIHVGCDPWPLVVTACSNHIVKLELQLHLPVEEVRTDQGYITLQKCHYLKLVLTSMSVQHTQSPNVAPALYFSFHSSPLCSGPMLLR